MHALQAICCEVTSRSDMIAWTNTLAIFLNAALNLGLSPDSSLGPLRIHCTYSNGGSATSGRLLAADPALARREASASRVRSLVGLKLTLLAGADADLDPRLRCHPAVCFLQAALCAGQWALWHSVEQYCARWRLLHFCTASSCSDGPLRF